MNGQLKTRSSLHARLDALIDAGAIGSGRLAPQEFWAFVAELAAAGGIPEGLHEAGLTHVQSVPKAPAKQFNERQNRAYQIGILAQLLLDAGQVGCAGKRADIFPPGFKIGALVHDLWSMLCGPEGMGDGEPLILRSKKGGKAALRRQARRALVGVVRYRMGLTGKTLDEVWGNLMAGRAFGRVKFFRWQKEFGGPTGELCVAAFSAGRNGTPLYDWGHSDEQLKPIIDLALSSQGKRASG